MDTVYELFQTVVEGHKDKSAIIENIRTMTFGKFSNMVDRIACSFPKEIHDIGIVIRHRAEMIPSILAVLKCGGRYIPAELEFPTGHIRTNTVIERLNREIRRTRVVGTFPDGHSAFILVCVRLRHVAGTQ